MAAHPIEEAYAALCQEGQDIALGGVWPPPTPDSFEQKARALALAVLEEVEGMAAGFASAEVNEVFVEDSIVPLRAEIERLGRERVS
jgi:hypothetical protein